MADSGRYICIHGHFYQPPRENPWLGTVEIQDSAAPYHDWNDRITAECYATNGASRVLDSRNEIIRIVNNYARISFNFGPTLLSWLAEKAPRTYRMILDADKRSLGRYGGHGSAMAQVYSHLIMPLASTRDRITQIRWGIADFESRFGRKPEGMWLAETAVDTESLELLAEHGILFTVLAPSQCAAVRALPSGGDKNGHVPSTLNGTENGHHENLPWLDTSNASVDTMRPYMVPLRTGKSIAVFFYDGPRSRAIAFEGLLNSGEGFARRLNGGFRDEAEGPQLVHVATDGESYGHHHKFGEMALSHALTFIEDKGLARLTNYGQFLEKFPPEYEARIVENSSWSCAHGVERWRADCGCNGGHAGWNQRWRKPLRDALDWLRDTVAPLSEEAGALLFTDVWEARDAYIAVVLDRNKRSIDTFLKHYATHPLNHEERVRALKLMELQRHTQLMYTSCGWFFDEISGIETVQIIAYASRVLQLASHIFGPAGGDLEEQFIERLRHAESNVAAEGDGAGIYLRSVKTMMVGLEQVAAHYAISSVFTTYPDCAPIYSYDVRRLDYDVTTSGRTRLVIGRSDVTSRITEDSHILSFAVLYFGEQNITAAVKEYREQEHAQYAAFSKEIGVAVSRADFPEAIRMLDRYFHTTAYSLTSLFRDDQRRILQLILNSTLKEVESSLSNIYEDHASLLHFLSQAGLPKPPALALAAGFSINAGLRRAIESRPIDTIQVRTLLALAKSDHIALDTPVLSYIADQQMKLGMVELYAQPDKGGALDEALLIATTLRELPFELNLWQAQNIWYDTLKQAMRVSRRNALGRRSADRKTPQGRVRGSDKAEIPEWWVKFDQLGRCLRIVVDELVVEEEAVPGEPATPALAVATTA